MFKFDRLCICNNFFYLCIVFLHNYADFIEGEEGSFITIRKDADTSEVKQNNISHLIVVAIVTKTRSIIDRFQDEATLENERPPPPRRLLWHLGSTTEPIGKLISLKIPTLVYVLC